MEDIVLCRAAIANKSYATIHGDIIDMNSAMAVVGVYEALREINRKRFLSFNIQKKVRVAWKIYFKHKA